MNPICKVDINRPECQEWMVKVYGKCRNLFNNMGKLPMWWLDNAPAAYKVDVEAMTAEDCHRLKRELGKEVEEEDTSTPSNEFNLGRMTHWKPHQSSSV
ncbi:hypothetical protein M5D96_003655 [Drosophila gunungcola]|uniref:Uncharacterized protein n=1 Tax=Drosophila gunungcola TaxID=103775 RepID=A0A9P9YT12_9MUSC|nr:hypothetical protein M5D96_003655 [Drosophila gunungcola]